MASLEEAPESVRKLGLALLYANPPALLEFPVDGFRTFAMRVGLDVASHAEAARWLGKYHGRVDESNSIIEHIMAEQIAERFEEYAKAVERTATK